MSDNSTHAPDFRCVDVDDDGPPTRTNTANLCSPHSVTDFIDIVHARAWTVGSVRKLVSREKCSTMMVLVTYDVTTTTTEGQARLRRVAKTCQNYRQRVQHSVFECLVDPAQFVKLKSELLKVIDEREDSLRFYFLGANWQHRVEHIGAKRSYDPQGLIIV